MSTTRTTTREGKAVKDRYLTIRIPFDIDQELRKLAAANTRTLAAQVLHYIKQGMANENTTEQTAKALANARLIAAAPELLAALEGMEKWASSIHDGYPPSTASIAAAPYREAARAAIARVKGGAA